MGEKGEKNFTIPVGIGEKMVNIPELLAPAGGMPQLKAAVENGADAVYLGGKLMNARINADNFDDEMMKAAVSYAHLRNVKVYVTMNILIKDDELEEALHYSKKLYEIGVDALIVQDLGFARLLKRRLPAMRLHLSTQGTVYNRSGVKLAKELGFERVVLAREVELSEMISISRENLAEMEVFVHGALCVCYSGQCQMSRVLGGRSGNRGMCAQPCRLPFTPEGERDGSYLLSPKDLCTIDGLGKLCEAGVAAIKIEGRMKSPEYVALVTGIYRKYLDEYKYHGKYEVSQEDRVKLQQVFNRGGFTAGYLEGNPAADLMSGELSKHQGVYIGKVISAAGRDLIDVELFQKLSMGDGVEIRNKNMPGNVVTYLKVIKDNVVRIGDIKGSVRSGDKVYKITDKELMNDAKETFDSKSSSVRRNYRKIDVNAEFTAKVGEYPKLVITEGGISIEKQGSEKGERAVNKAITPDYISKQLGKTGDLPFNIEKTTFNIEENISLPVSTINNMRREAFEELAQIKTKERKLTTEEQGFFYEFEISREKDLEGARKRKNLLDRLEIGERTLELYFLTEKLADEAEISHICQELKPENARIERINVFVPLYEYMADIDCEDSKFQVIRNMKFEGQNINVIPYLPNITKGAYDAFIKENFESIIYHCTETGISIGNLGWIREFRDAGIDIYGDYGLNIYNNEAIGCMEDMKVLEFVPSHEIYKNPDLEDGWKCLFCYSGKIPLMISEHMYEKKGFSDRKDMEFLFKENTFENKSIIVQKNTGDRELTLESAEMNSCKKIRVYFA